MEEESKVIEFSKNFNDAKSLQEESKHELEVYQSIHSDSTIENPSDDFCH